MFIIVLFFNAIFILAKMEFQFTELMSGQSLKEISKPVDLFPPPSLTPPPSQTEGLFIPG